MIRLGLLVLGLLLNNAGFSQEIEWDNSVFRESFEGMFQASEIQDVPMGVATPSPPVPLDRDLIVLFAAALVVGTWNYKRRKDISANI
jgi:hypothetical protein